MLIPEAVHLVLIAAASGKVAIFILDMGERVKIIDMAENFIQLSGLFLTRN
jgi:FlaA1/EpsC-like NDP-sugar epimerase